MKLLLMRIERTIERVGRLEDVKKVAEESDALLRELEEIRTQVAELIAKIEKLQE